MWKMVWLVLAVLLQGCAITQTVKPFKDSGIEEVCIIENPSVRYGFLAAYKHALEENGYKTKILRPMAAVDECAVTTTYTANWLWDLALYMAYAEIRVYHRGQLSGEALYDSKRGGGNPGKFINAESKVRELAQALFPNN
jgi:hypothetical protein